MSRRVGERAVLRNPVGFFERLGRFRGDPVEFGLHAYQQALDDINRLAGETARLTDAQIEARARALREQVRQGTRPREVRNEVFALAREASARRLGLRPFDEQVVAALALDEGAVVEMQTGEGKTLAAVMPVCLTALEGRGAHVLTFNEYLARRDAEWMGPVYEALGLSVGSVGQETSGDERRRAYAADVTYVTAKQAGFDLLRDLLARDPAHVVHRPFHFALVDEADSLLIDEARSPLVIAGSTGRRDASARHLARLVASLVPGRHFDTDEYQRDVELTEAGVEAIEASLGCGNLHDARNLALLTGVNCALHARVLLKRDVDYIVRDGRVDIVDEFTGRVVRDRHWPDGLQAALEAKEGLESAGDGEILGTVTLQHFLRGYPRLCGMTGTARDAAAEVEEFYGLKTVVVPTHRPMVRVDHPDVLFTHREAKEKAVVEEVRRAHATGRPVLVGTLTVEESERLAGRLKAAGVECEVLNAKNDALEAGVVSRAGRLGAVTISTNMAGRGTDIRLGGPDETDHDQVAALGGLYVIGTNRHESRRVDLQLRGRAGRQGDPGESRFFVCLEDDLLVRYDIGSLIPARAWPAESNDPLDHPVIRREMARAQRIIEGQNLEIRRTLWRYSSAVEAQRVRTMTRRQAVLADASEADTWVQEPDRRAALVRAAGEAAVQRAEQAVTLFHLDRAWRDHLALIADVREGIHLVALGGGDPLTRFSAEVGQAYERMEEALDEAILGEMDRVRITAEGVRLPGIDVTGPSSTWTYIVTDDPFRNQIGRMLTGPGRTSIAIYAAVVMMPLLLLWGIVDRLFGKQPRRRR